MRDCRLVSSTAPPPFHLSVCALPHATHVITTAQPSVPDAHTQAPQASRQLGDLNPCGQSPMDFESITLTTRSNCPCKGSLTHRITTFPAQDIPRGRTDSGSQGRLSVAQGGPGCLGESYNLRAPSARPKATQGDANSPWATRDHHKSPRNRIRPVQGRAGNCPQTHILMHTQLPKPALNSPG